MFDHFENLYVITDQMIVSVQSGRSGIDLGFSCTKDIYLPGETVRITGGARNASWVGVLTDLYIAYQNKQTGELLFLPGPSREVRPFIAGFWANRRSPLFLGEADIGPAPDTPGNYSVLIGFMFEGRLDLLSSTIGSFDITVAVGNE